MDPRLHLFSSFLAYFSPLSQSGCLIYKSSSYWSVHVMVGKDYLIACHCLIIIMIIACLHLNMSLLARLLLILRYTENNKSLIKLIIELLALLISF